MAWHGFSVTGGLERRFFDCMATSMPADPDYSRHEEDSLEDTELVRRLRRMEWPAASPDVKARVLRRIVDGHGDERDTDESGSSQDLAG